MKRTTESYTTTIRFKEKVTGCHLKTSVEFSKIGGLPCVYITQSNLEDDRLEDVIVMTQEQLHRAIAAVKS